MRLFSLVSYLRLSASTQEVGSLCGLVSDRLILLDWNADRREVCPLIKSSELLTSYGVYVTVTGYGPGVKG